MSIQLLLLAATLGLLIGSFITALMMDFSLRQKNPRLTWLHIRAIRQRNSSYIIAVIALLVIAMFVGWGLLLLGAGDLVWVGIILTLILTIFVIRTALLTYKSPHPAAPRPAPLTPPPAPRP